MTTTQEPIIGTIYQSFSEYAERDDTPSPRTIKRALAKGEIPGAERDGQGRWRIPYDAVRTVPETFTLASPPVSKELAVRTEPILTLTTLTEHRPAELVNPELVDRLPTFLTVPQAAYLLEISEGTIMNKGNRKYFRLRKIDRKLHMPLSRVKKLRGIR
jgi:hypothetical protein